MCSCHAPPSKAHPSALCSEKRRHTTPHPHPLILPSHPSPGLSKDLLFSVAFHTLWFGVLKFVLVCLFSSLFFFDLVLFHIDCFDSWSFQMMNALKNWHCSTDGSNAVCNRIRLLSVSEPLQWQRRPINCMQNNELVLISNIYILAGSEMRGLLGYLCRFSIKSEKLLICKVASLLFLLNIFQIFLLQCIDSLGRTEMSTSTIVISVFKQ